MLIHPNMAWAIPYIVAVNKVMPLGNVDYIKGYRLRVGQKAETSASIIKVGRRYRINIRISSDYVTEKGVLGYRDWESLLVAMAHEFAHMKHWEHTPEHLELTGKFLKMFGRVAKREGLRGTHRRIRRLK